MGFDELHAELLGKKYRYMRPHIEKAPWGVRLFRVIDPFGNTITFDDGPSATRKNTQ